MYAILLFTTRCVNLTSSSYGHRGSVDWSISDWRLTPFGGTPVDGRCETRTTTMHKSSKRVVLECSCAVTPNALSPYGRRSVTRRGEVRKVCYAFSNRAHHLWRFFKAKKLISTVIFRKEPTPSFPTEKLRLAVKSIQFLKSYLWPLTKCQ